MATAIPHKKVEAIVAGYAMSPIAPLGQIAAGGSCRAGFQERNATKMQPSSGSVMSAATTKV
jgi:hypothetical protein